MLITLHTFLLFLTKIVRYLPFNIYFGDEKFNFKKK